MMDLERTLFSWVHLSDIHVLHGNSHNHADQTLMMQALVQEFGASPFCSCPSIAKPDAIFVTGDIAFSGGEKDPREYSIAEEWLGKLSAAASVDTKDVFLVPGNHDIQRELPDEEIALLLDSLRDDKRKLEWALDHPKYAERLTRRLQNYSQFSSKFGVSERKQIPFWQHSFHVTANLEIRLLGLNTVLLSQDDTDKGKLRLSLNQFKQFPDHAKSNQVSIGLSHHPMTWLADGEDTEAWLRKKIQIHLCGHIHEPESMSCRYGSGTNLIRIQAGAFHVDAEKRRTSNCFNCGSIILDDSGKLCVRVWTRSWSETNKDFRDFPDSHDPKKPFAEFPLPDIEFSTATNRISVTIPEGGAGAREPVHKNNFVSDSPPVVDVWVGRESELSMIGQFQSGVVAVTGIGGQGKSALASKYLEQWSKVNSDSYIDWRDCREQSEQFHTKILSIIENLSNGRITSSGLERDTIKELVQLLFQLAAGRKALIVLDNVDQYVDVSAGRFTLGMADFVDFALRRPHNVTILITCRPRVNYANPRFQEVHLEGISVKETGELFRLRGVKIDDDTSLASVGKICDLTNGHPFWLNLIGTQIAKGLPFEEVISKLEHGEVDARALTMMRFIWEGLNRKQKTILRYMAEMSKPEDIDWIHECVKGDLGTWNRFNPVFKHLKSLNLITEARSSRGKKEFDLHPIVRHFVRTEFHSRSERIPILDRLIFVINLVIKGSHISSSSHSISFLEYSICKAELEVEKEDFETAIKTLSSIGPNLVLLGIPGDLFRVGEMILTHCEDRYERLLDLKEFHNLNTLLGKTYVEYGRKDDAQRHVERYTRMVPRNTANYIRVCDCRSYIEWFVGNYADAVYWGEEGLRIKNDSGLDTSFDTEHNLALARRDSGNIEPALLYFLNGSTLEAFLSNTVRTKKRDATDFGNVGRCLQLKGLNDLALTAFVISVQLLEAKEEDGISRLNKGYAYSWIAEVLEKKDDLLNACLFYRYAETIWSQRSPLKANEPKKRFLDIKNKLQKPDLVALSDAGVERNIRQWLHKYHNSVKENFTKGL